MRIAVEGCGHGQLDDIYAEIQRRTAGDQHPVDLLIICGDFQAVRNHADLATLACPPKYRKLGDFHRYYSGERKAPIPTVFVGGNHEASNHMQELFYGGWVCPNIYYLGRAGVIQFGGVRIAGLSGTFSEHHYHLGNYEKPPYTPRSERSIYHARVYDVMRLAQMRSPIEIMISHDWPIGITKFGDEATLLRRKPFFKADIQKNQLGSPPNQYLLHHLRPRRWLSAHLHVRFVATVPHPETTSEGVEDVLEEDAPAIVSNPAAIQLDLEDSDSDDAVSVEFAANPDTVASGQPDGDSQPGVQTAMPEPLDVSTPTEKRNRELVSDIVAVEDTTTIEDSTATKRSRLSTGQDPNSISLSLDDEETDSDSDTEDAVKDSKPPTASSQLPPLPEKRGFPATHFLALDKCLPRRQFLEILEVEAPHADKPPKLTYDPEWLAILRATRPYMSLTEHQPPPPTEQQLRRVIEQERAWVAANFSQFDIPTQFEQTAPPPTPAQVSGPVPRHVKVPAFTRHPQTTRFCQLLGIAEPIW